MRAPSSQWRRLQSSALALLLFLNRAWAQPPPIPVSKTPPAPPSTNAPPRVAAQRVANVCTTMYPPLTTCSQGAQGGYEIELFKRTADQLMRAGDPQWAPGNYTFVCWDSWNALLADIKKDKGERICDIMVAGVSATDERKTEGIQFSYSTLESGRRIMIHIDDQRGMWSFLQPFEPSLWVACFGTSALVGLLLLLSESPLSGLWGAPQPALQRAAGTQWGALSILLRMASQLSPHSTGGRLILAGYGFLVYILANLYISAESAILASRTTSSAFHDMEDLMDVPIGVFVDDKFAFQRFALNDVYYLPWATDEDEANMLAMLRRGTLKALVLDAPWVTYTAASACDLFVVGQLVLPVHLGFAFPNDTSQDILAAFDSALSYLDDTGVMVTLQRQYLHPTVPCHAAQGSDTDVLNPQIKLEHVSGLWVLLACCVGLCLLWNCCVWIWRYHKSRTLARASGTASHKSSASGAAGLPSNQTFPLNNASDATTTAMALGGAATHDEALQAMDMRLRQMDNLIRHMPFVIVATLDARLSDLKAQLMASPTPWQHNPHPSRNGPPTGSRGSADSQQQTARLDTRDGILPASATSAGQRPATNGTAAMNAADPPISGNFSNGLVNGNGSTKATPRASWAPGLQDPTVQPVAANKTRSGALAAASSGVQLNTLSSPGEQHTSNGIMPKATSGGAIGAVPKTGDALVPNGA